ncbi:MAG: hypothetical protein ACI4RA_07910 [Kiritimatiellia bacterium]
MKRQIVCIIAAVACLVTLVGAPCKVVLVVQNHGSPGTGVPIQSLTDALTAQLTKHGFSVVNPYNLIGENLNRTSAGEEMPKVSAIEMARLAKADGALTASVLQFTDQTRGTPVISHQYRIRLGLNLADAKTGATICGAYMNQAKVSPQYTVRQDAANRHDHLYDLVFAAADECSADLAEELKKSNWHPAAPAAPVVCREVPNPQVAPVVTRPAPPPTEPPTCMPRPPTPSPLSVEELDNAVHSLVKMMLENELFKANYREIADTTANKLPIAILGGLTDETGEPGMAALCAAVGETLRMKLYDSALFDVKNDEMIEQMTKRILASGNSPLEDSEIMSALKKHGSPDVLAVARLRKFGKNYRFSLSLYGLASGKIVWERFATIVK